MRYRPRAQTDLARDNCVKTSIGLDEHRRGSASSALMTKVVPFVISTMGAAATPGVVACVLPYYQGVDRAGGGVDLIQVSVCAPTINSPDGYRERAA